MGGVLLLILGVFFLTYIVISVLPNFWINAATLSQNTSTTSPVTPWDTFPHSSFGDTACAGVLIIVGIIFVLEGFKKSRFSFRTNLVITCLWIGLIWFFFAFLSLFISYVDYVYPTIACVLAGMPFIVLGFLFIFLPSIHFKFSEMSMAQLFLTAMLFLGGALMSVSAFVIVSNPQFNKERQNWWFVSVPADKMWFDTGIDIPSNSTVHITHQFGYWKHGWDSVRNKNGVIISTVPLLPKEKLGALVGKIGKREFVGNSELVIDAGGRLYLSINDFPEGFEDNSGEITVEIKVR
jgi:hypothetical protein